MNSSPAIRASAPLALALAVLAAPSTLRAAAPAPIAAWDDVDNPSMLTNSLAMPRSFTAMAWFEAGSFADFAPILAYTSDFSAWTNGFGIFTTGDGAVAAFVRSLDEAVVAAGGEGVGTNVPCHVALAYSGTSATLYLDGVPAATTNFAASVPLDCGGPLWAGTPPGIAESPAFDGAIAGVRLFAGALCWADVASAYVADRNASLAADGADVSRLDSDGDGMPDAWELRFAFNPLDSSDAALDSDGDGMSNFGEFRRGRNPRAGAVAASPSLISACTASAP